jgi:RHS repeat-associated protein
MYAGPMKKISYTYATENGDPLIHVVAGQIYSENNGNTGQIVSRLYIPFVTWRNEIRGDGPSRHFEYGGALLQRYTDFKGQYSSISYDGNGFASAFTDARGKTTTTLREETIGALRALTHPDPEQSNQRFIYKEVDGGRYFLQIAGDERNFNSNTYFTRDDITNRVTKIWYPDYPTGPTEEFTYNGFGQVETHTMTSGGVENFRYDSRGMLYLSWPPATPSDPNPQDHPTRYFYYMSGPQMDRLWYVTDPRGNTTWFEYNTRGQVTKVTYQDGSYRQAGYNADGTLAWTADENHPGAATDANERTRYLYDDYKRVISVTNPLNKTATLSYAPWSGAGSNSHTTASVYRATSPMGKLTDFDYDENFRRKMVRQGSGSADDDGGTWFGYDEVGNLTSVQDPRGNVTAFGYDERNRRTSMTHPVPFNNQITRWEYDTRSNLTKETRPDQLYRRLEYDPQSRVIDAYGFAGEHRHYERDLAGNVRQLTDPKTAIYFFDYDVLNRKIGATYPLDATNANRTESYAYDITGNLVLYKNPAGQYKHLDFSDSYDSRNRLRHTGWNLSSTTASADWSVGQEVTANYDYASRLTSVTTNGGATTVSFGYDDANRQTWEEQTVAGYPTRRIETPRDDDGLRASLATPAYTLSYGYTGRRQLRIISFANGTPWFSYSYDLAGNLTKRQDVLGDVNDSTNVMDASGVSQHDALNRPTMWEQTGTVDGTHDSAFARSHFGYDNLSRLTASWRDEQAGKGEWFGYHATGQLTDVAYNADNVSSGTPQNATRTINYTMTADTLNRSTMTDSPNEFGAGGELSVYTPNALNQYIDLNGGGFYYDGNFNLMWTGGFSAGYDADKRLTAIGSGENYGQFVYDGLGRCLKRTVDWETILITYDGWKPIVEWDEWNNLKAWNVYGPGPDEILYRHDAYLDVDLRYHLDRMGNVVFLLDSDGYGIERYTYDAFGTPIVTDWNGNNPRPYSWYGNRFMFTGREYFPELGLYDYRNRFYSPPLGRFLQSDPIGFGGGDSNLFRYCGGDPVNRGDPFGLTSPDPTKLEDRNTGSAYYGYDPYPGSGPLEGIDESTMNVITIGGPPSGNGPVIGPWGQQSTTGASNMGPNDHGSGAGPGGGWGWRWARPVRQWP